MQHSPERIEKRAGLEDGVVLNITMRGDGIHQCVYTVQAFVGSNRREFPLQIDTGSSDMWIASTSCQSDPDCTTYQGSRYDAASAASTTDVEFDIAYHRGQVKGPVVIDKVDIGGYIVERQAFSAARELTNEPLNTGTGFAGLLGLAPQANSIIADQLRRSSSPLDGQTVASHILANTTQTPSTPSPSSKFLSLLLERPHFPNIASYLGIGAHPPLPPPFSANDVRYSPIIETDPGPLFWRVPLTRITIYLDSQPIYIPLSTGTLVPGLQSIWPVAVFDSGGTEIITTREIANSVYGVWGIGPGKFDNKYYVPCNLLMNMTFMLGAGISIEVPIHPLDMSHDIPTEPGGPTCLGGLQASDQPISAGDLVLGAAFMRNVYTVLSYQANPPQLGFLPLTNPTVALEEFNTIRIQKKPLGSGLSPSEQLGNSTSTTSPTTSGSSKHSKAGYIALGCVGGFVVVAAIAIWFGLRKLRQRNAKAADKGTPLDEPEMGIQEMKMARMKNVNVEVHGVQVDEAYNMFGGVPHSPNAPLSANKGSIGLASWTGAGQIGERYPRPKGARHISGGLDGDLLSLPGVDPFQKYEPDTPNSRQFSTYSASGTSLAPSTDEQPVTLAPTFLTGPSEGKR